MDYGFRAWDEGEGRPLDRVALSFDDMFELIGLKVDFEDAVSSGEMLDGSPAPSGELVAAMPRFDPERWVLTQEDPEWVPVGDDSAYAPRGAVMRWVSAMGALESFVPEDARAPWDRVLATLSQLAVAGRGLHCGAMD